ncbi:cupredoxin domain-containing protein [Janthinobacterium sp. GW458P]|uniref:cupredoxin domain-containing protein n=1 Tax=Janthinobacterium sp. GW458P TaxID=1981504 RepID=UPI000A326485|nr:cupredoxin domain-containing protein [Janthinobacterium sp. GW458P]MBE3024745.1 cupredoxin domain-containing protein [Janthinobacterium sp. GW458P]PHV17952.1 cytochrome-c oxidase [Janthinobacterium sp. BJB303]
MDRARRHLCARLACGFGALLTIAAIDAQGLRKIATKERVIAIEARKFVYTPHEITLKKDETVVLAFTAVDFIHGFFIPDMHIRADLKPGQVTEVRLTPGKAGEYAFLCDNFCGSGHEEMNGKIIVTA